MMVAHLQSFILDFLDAALWTPLVTSDMFTRGFFWGLVVALAVGTLSRLALYVYAPIKVFFKPTQRPATQPGPSPYSRLIGCFGSLLKLGLIAAILILLVYVAS